MSLSIQRASPFVADFEREFARYRDEAGAELARCFQRLLDATLRRLSDRPDLGRPRHFKHPKLRELRSFRVEHPFDKLLIFYRVESDHLQVIRLMHGARDLPRRLVEPS